MYMCNKLFMEWYCHFTALYYLCSNMNERYRVSLSMSVYVLVHTFLPLTVNILYYPQVFVHGYALQDHHA